MPVMHVFNTIGVVLHLRANTGLHGDDSCRDPPMRRSITPARNWTEGMRLYVWVVDTEEVWG